MKLFTVLNTKYDFEYFRYTIAKMLKYSIFYTPIHLVNCPFDDFFFSFDAKLARRQKLYTNVEEMASLK